MPTTKKILFGAFVGVTAATVALLLGNYLISGAVTAGTVAGRNWNNPRAWSVAALAIGWGLAWPIWLAIACATDSTGAHDLLAKE